MARLRQPLRQRSAASDSILRRRKEEWFRLQNVTTTRLHRFLISVPDLGIDARFSTETSSIVHRFLISGPDLGVDASFAGFLAARRGGFAQSLRSFAGSLAARRGGPCKDGIYQGVARPGGPLFRFVGSGLVKASFRRPGPQNEISIACAMLTP